MQQVFEDGHHHIVGAFGNCCWNMVITCQAFQAMWWDAWVHGYGHAHGCMGHSWGEFQMASHLSDHGYGHDHGCGYCRLRPSIVVRR